MDQECTKEEGITLDANLEVDDDNRARLVFMSMGEQGRICNIKDTAYIGRDPGVEVYIDSGAVSRQHALLYSEQGRWLVEDLSSSNGTRLNSVRLDPGCPATIEFGDRLTLGEGAILVLARYDPFEDKVLELAKIEAVGRLAGSVAHDFNNILAAVLNNVDFITMAIREDTFERGELIECLDESRTALHRAAELTRQLLGVARRDPSKDAPVNISALAAEVAQLCQRMFKGDHSVELSAADELRLSGNRTQLHQMMLNLCINARDAMPGGGVVVFDVRREQLQEGDPGAAFMALSGSYITITVTDTGVGLDERTKRRIFEPFYTTKGDLGTGLGLATVSNVVNNHGGDITVISSPGAGTTFRIVLPVGTASMDLDAPLPDTLFADSSASPAPEGATTILVVDDDPVTTHALSSLLEIKGLAVLHAANGKEAVSCYEQNRERIGTILLDMVMPKMDGRDTLRILNTIGCSAKVILMSAEVDDASVRDLLSMAAGFLTKPIDAELLFSVIRN